MGLLTVVLVRSPHKPDARFQPQFPAYAKRRASALSELHRTVSGNAVVERVGDELRVLASAYYAPAPDA